MKDVDWKPYPENKPSDEDEYQDFLITIFDGSNTSVTIDQWLSVGCWDRYLDFEVIAWAEKPEPYKPQEPLDMHPDAITARKYAEGDPETVKALHIFDE